jgi:hypothetical protein
MASNLTAHRRVVFLHWQSMVEIDMYAINMQAARWKVHLRCSQFALHRFNTLYLD